VTLILRHLKKAESGDGRPRDRDFTDLEKKARANMRQKGNRNPSTATLAREMAKIEGLDDKDQKREDSIRVALQERKRADIKRAKKWKINDHTF